MDLGKEGGSRQVAEDKALKRAPVQQVKSRGGDTGPMKGRG